MAAGRTACYIVFARTARLSLSVKPLLSCAALPQSGRPIPRATIQTADVIDNYHCSVFYIQSCAGGYKRPVPPIINLSLWPVFVWVAIEKFRQRRIYSYSVNSSKLVIRGVWPVYFCVIIFHRCNYAPAARRSNFGRMKRRSLFISSIAVRVSPAGIYVKDAVILCIEILFFVSSIPY